MQKITVQGVEYDLELTVGAFAEISEACPNGDFSRIDELFQLPPGKAMLAAAKMLAAMSRGAEEKKRYEDPSYSPHPLTYQELVNLPSWNTSPSRRSLLRLWAVAYRSRKSRRKLQKKRKKQRKNNAQPTMVLVLRAHAAYAEAGNPITTYGEMCDMISCLAVYNGSEKIKQSPSMRMEDILSLR